LPTIRVDFSVDDTHSSIAALLQRVLAGGSQLAGDIVVDLEACQFLGPSAVVILAGLRRRAEAQGSRLTIVPPELPRLLNYCRYSGLLAEFGVGPPPEPHTENVTTPVRSFVREFPLTAINEVVLLAKREMELSRTAQDDLTLVLSELTQNVIDHSESSVGGFLSARAYKNVRDVRFAVADFGVGIRRTLARRFDIATDRDAIRRAVQEEITSRSSVRNLGLGLAHLHEIVKITRGRMVMYSGHGYLRHERRKDVFGALEVAFPGTIVFVRLPIREEENDGEEVTDIWK